MEKPLTTAGHPEIPIHIGHEFRVKKTGETGECFEVDNSVTPPRLHLKFAVEKTEWHCRSKVTTRIFCEAKPSELC
jgi:hypothetical protein